MISKRKVNEPKEKEVSVEIEERIRLIETWYGNMAERIRESRRTGNPIRSDDLEQKKLAVYIPFSDVGKKSHAGLMFHH